MRKRRTDTPILAAVTAAQLPLISPARTIKKMVAARSSKYSGDAFFKQGIIDGKAEPVGMKEVSGTISKNGFCFAAGTLVHGKDGLIPIESIRAGDWVLAQPEKTGELAYKRVVRTTHFESKPVYRVSYYSDSNPAKTGNLIVTGHHPFYVAGYVKEDFAQSLWPELDQRIGWRSADQLEYGELLLLASGERVRVGSVAPIWRTRKDGIGWIATSSSSQTGRLIDLRDGKVQIASDFVSSDYAGEGSFNERYELEETIEEWAYKCDVYNFEVEEFHTYYVGETGVWVHDTDLP